MSGGLVFVRPLGPDGEPEGEWVNVGVVRNVEEAIWAGALADITARPGSEQVEDIVTDEGGRVTIILRDEPVQTPEANYHDLGSGALLSEILGTIDGALQDTEGPHLGYDIEYEDAADAVWPAPTGGSSRAMWVYEATDEDLPEG